MLALALSLLIGELALDTPPPAFEGTLSGEVRGRTRLLEGEADATPEISINPRAGLSLPLGAAAFEATYSIDLLLSDPGGSAQQALFLQTGRLGLFVQSGSRLSVRFGAGASYGVRRYSLIGSSAGAKDTAGSDAAVPPPALEPLPSSTELLTQDGDLSAGISWWLTRRLSTDLDLAVRIGGGADAEARRSLPLREEALLSWAMLYDESRRERYGVGFDASWTRLAPVSVGALAVAGATPIWLYEIADGTRLEVRAGAQLTEDVEGGGAPRLDPRARVALSHDAGEHSMAADVSLSATLWPRVDNITGSLYQQVECVGSLGVPISDSLRVSASVGATIGLEAPRDREATANVELGAGSREDTAGALSWRAGVRAGASSDLLNRSAPAWQGAVFLAGAWTGRSP